MLADVKPEIKSEATPVVAGANSDEVEINKMAQQIRVFHDRLNNNSTVTQPPTISPPAATTAQELPGQPLVNFGWAEIENAAGSVSLPFVRQHNECYVANKIYCNKIIAEISKILSKKVINCVILKTYPMTKSEADVFNEINVQHCDGSLVGNYHFTEGMHMSYLEDIKRSINFFEACMAVLCFNKIDNDLFGFIKIDGGSEVPFIWNEGQKLVPLFYFEGQSNYLDKKSIDLTDTWQLGYLKFCCLVQNIRKDHYERNPLKVVNFEHLKTLFPENTTFQLHWPQNANQEFLAPELTIAALHGVPESSLLHLTLNNNYVPQQQFAPSASMPSSLQQAPAATKHPPNKTVHPNYSMPNISEHVTPNNNSIPQQQFASSSSTSSSLQPIMSIPSNERAANKRTSVPVNKPKRNNYSMPDISEHITPNNNSVPLQQFASSSSRSSAATKCPANKRTSVAANNPKQNSIETVNPNYSMPDISKHITPNNNSVPLQKFALSSSRSSVATKCPANKRTSVAANNPKQNSIETVNPNYSMPDISEHITPNNNSVPQQQFASSSTSSSLQPIMSVPSNEKAATKRPANKVTSVPVKKPKRNNLETVNSNYSMPNISETATITPVENHTRITNVPYASPPTASSPECCFFSPEFSNQAQQVYDQRSSVLTQQQQVMMQQQSNYPDRSAYIPPQSTIQQQQILRQQLSSPPFPSTTQQQNQIMWQQQSYSAYSPPSNNFADRPNSLSKSIRQQPQSLGQPQNRQSRSQPNNVAQITPQCCTTCNIPFQLNGLSEKLKKIVSKELWNLNTVESKVDNIVCRFMNDQRLTKQQQQHLAPSIKIQVYLLLISAKQNNTLSSTSQYLPPSYSSTDSQNVNITNVTNVIQLNGNKPAEILPPRTPENNNSRQTINRNLMTVPMDQNFYIPGSVTADRTNVSPHNKGYLGTPPSHPARDFLSPDDGYWDICHSAVDILRPDER